jgi:ATP-dependent exoDNAse (exonuclease V) alpha subunit
LHDEKARQLVYVGLSRARNHAVILGELPAPDALIIDSETEGSIE